jgi:phytol kinase
VTQDVRAFLYLVAYYVVAAGLIAVASLVAPRFHQEGARKAYHVMACFSILILFYCFSTWYRALVGMIGLLLIGFVVMFVVQRFGVLSSISIARARRHEILYQIVYFQFTIAVLLAVFWGLLGPGFRYLATVGIVAWGFGDPAAALIGKRFGHLKLTQRWFDRQKSVAGSSAMFVASSASILAVLGLLRGGPWGVLILVSLALGAVATLVEAMTKHGLDTITLPLSVAAAAVPLLALFSRLWGIPWP